MKQEKQLPLFDVGHWRVVRDGNYDAFCLFSRHYSFYQYKDGRRDDPTYRNRHLIGGPGEKMLLLTQNADALFGWRKFIDASGQVGVNCAAFRNESDIQSSTLIESAEQLARLKWPQERFYTYVDPGKVKSRNPGYCFKRAGWKRVGETKKRGLVILEKLPPGYGNA